MDSVEIKQLVMENEKLRRELESVKYQKDLLVKAIAGRGGGEAEKILSAENQSLKDEITDLKNQLSVANKREQEIGELNRTIEDLQERLSILTKGCNWKTAVHQNVLKSMGVSAQALCYAVKGYSVKEIVQELNDEVTERTVYRALSVKEDTDLQRITTILHQFKEVFDSHDVTEDDVLKWFTGLRVKKLRLVTRDELIKYFGEETLNVARRDAYVQGEYYNVKNIEL